MGLTCGGKEIEIGREKEIVDAMEELQVAHYELMHSEIRLQEQLKRRRWYDLSVWEKFKMLFGWDPNGS